MTSVSSLCRAPEIIELPLANAAQINARFVKLLLPGGRMLPTTRSTGTISTNGLAGRSDIISFGKEQRVGDSGSQRRVLSGDHQCTHGHHT